MAYTGHTWQVNEAITRGKMNSIEQGIVDASSLSETNFRSINQINTKVGDGLSSGTDLTQKVAQLDEAVRNLSGPDLSNVVNEVKDSHNSQRLTGNNNMTHTYSSLFYHLAALDIVGNRVDEAIGTDLSLLSKLNKMSTETSNAAHTAMIAYNNSTFASEAINDTLRNTSYLTLTQRLDGMTTELINTIHTYVGELGTYSNAVDYVEGRLGFDNGSTYTAKEYTDNAISGTVGTLTGAATVAAYVNNQRDAAISSSNSYTDNQIASISSSFNNVVEIEDAHRQDVANDTLDNRFDDIESAISHAAQGNDAGGLTERLSGLENSVNHTVTGLAATRDALNTLAQAVDNLDIGAATIIIPENKITYNQETGLPTIYTDSNKTTIDNTISENYDYLLQKNDKYYYWKYINNSWELISGGGGNGTSSAVIAAELPAASNANENVDYYIGNNNDGYIHYRYIAPTAGESSGHYIKILPNNIINKLNTVTVSLENGSVADQWPTANTFVGGLEAYNINDTTHETNLLEDFVAVRNARINAVYEGDDPNNQTLKSQTLQVLDTNGKLMEYPIVGGGSGNAASIYNAYIESSTSMSRSVPTTNTNPITIVAKVIIKQGNTLLQNATAEGIIQYRQRGTTIWNTGENIEVESDTEDTKYTILNNTNFTVDITKYLQEDTTMEFRLVLNAYPASEEDVLTVYSSTFRVSMVNISIAAEAFDYYSVKSSNFQFNYRCYGAGITKTVHFLMDDDSVEMPTTEIATVSVGTSNNTLLQQQINMIGKNNGMYKLQVYFTTNTGLESNRLNYFILYNTDNTRQAPIIGAAAEKTSITDGDELIVNYSVNTIGTETTDSVEIELYTLDEHDEKDFTHTTTLTKVANNKLADPPYRTFNYPKVVKEPNAQTDPEPITVYVKLTAYHTVEIDNTPTVLSDSQTVKVLVNYLNTKYNLEPEGTSNILFDYQAYGRSNNDEVKETFVYPFTSISGEVINFTGTFNNFNWATDGYVDGESLLIGGGATVNIDVPIFNSKVNDISIEENANIGKITTNGRTIEIDYEVLSTTNLGATIIDCMTTGANPKGFRVTPQNCYLLNSGSNIDIDETGFIKNEENVAAAYLNPGTRTHLTFVIEPVSTTLAADGTYHQSTNIYINGEFANACPYNTVGNDFDNNATITIGSDTCLIKLYSIKLYNRGLTEDKVLHNYAVAPVATRDKITRLEDNDILNQYGQVDYEKARKKYTCLLLTGMGTVNGVAVPTMAPYKGYPSVVGRTKDNEPVGKTESGLLLTKPTNTNSAGYTVEFDLQDKLIDGNNIYGYASSNNVQGTSSQKFPVKNLKVYLAKGDDTTEMAFDTNIDVSVKKVYKYSINNAAKAAYQSVYPSAESLPEYITNCGESIATTVKNLSEVPTQAEVITLIETYLNAEDTDVGAAYSSYSTGDELITHPILGYKKSKKVKYALRENGIGESTLCWKADYMSTDHANTFNANIANTLYSNDDRLSDRWTDQTQYTVYGIKCLLFQQDGTGAPQFVGDGCLNNDKGNNKTFGLETDISGVWKDEDDNTMCQKWDFRNNTGSLLYFKHDGLFETIDGKPAVSRELECIYPDEGDLADIGITPNYNHFQILSSWLGNRANYWYESDASKRAAKKQIFINEFTNHFNLNHILIYYLFMEYTALCDNRVKNIHMRTDNAGLEIVKDISGNILLNGNENPNSGPWTLAENLETRVMQEPIMDENGDYQFDQNGNMELGNVSHVFVKDTVINNIDWQQGENHSNFAIWAPVLYDLDSCFSADNVGYLKIRYDADWDYSLYNKLKFAGFDSILWLQVEDCFQDELKVMAKKLYNRVVGLNYSTFYRQQITDNLASLCPAITNQDMILKYDKPWTEGFLDYTKNPPVPSTDKYKYLQRGTRTGQKAIFMKQRSLFLASKYDGNEFIQDKITFRSGTQVNQENSILTLVANQKLYPGAQFGDVNDTTKITRRASKIYDSTQEEWIDIGAEDWVPEFTPCQIQHSGNMNNTDGVEIYGASVLNDIGDISRFHPWQVKVGNAVNLKKLILGSNTPGYSNTTTDDIDGLNACTLLEEINVCNLKNLTSLQLTNNGFIKKVYATGSGLNTIALPRGGVLDTIAYGANTTDITIINQSRLTNFSYENSVNNNYANVSRLWIENCDIPVYNEYQEITGYTCAIPIKDIVTARLTSTSSSDHGLRAGGLRLVGIHLNLGADDSFLKLLASDLVKGTYLSAEGGHIEGTEETPYITGTITVTNLRESVFNKLKELYPLLVVNVTGTLIREYALTFKNVDKDNNQTTLITMYRTSNDTFPDPITDTDPVTNKTYIQSAPANQIALNGKGLWVPIKDEDEGHVYYVGTYNSSNEYKRYSGWQIISDGTNATPTSGTIINKNMTLIAVYPTTVLKKYRVRWYDDTNTVIQMSEELEYGTDASNLAQPNKENGMIVKKYSSSAQKYKVFKGWDRPVGKINGNIDIHSLWYESNGVDSITDINDLNPADLYALTLKNGDQRRTLLDDILGRNVKYIQMGRDFEYDPNYIITHNLMPANTNALYLNSEDPPIRLIFNGQNNQEAIYPLLNLNNSFTLAIDFKFLMDEDLWNLGASEYVLFSCYRNLNGSSNGFKVSIVKSSSGSERDLPPIRVFWGNQSVDIDHSLFIRPKAGQAIESYNNYRNMLVLRHNGNEPSNLYVYYHAPDTTNRPEIYNTNGITSTILTWNSSVNVEMPLILGGNYTTEGTIESDIRYPATGIIYYAKYWEDDIGDSNAIELASWPHETVGFKICGYDNGDNGSGGRLIVGSTNNINFSAVQTIGDKYCYYKKQSYGEGYAFNGNDITDQLNCTFGWHNSDIHKYINKTIYDAFPVAYQSIIVKTNLNSVAQSRDAGVISSVTVNSNDYIYLPAYYELEKDTTKIPLGSIYRNEAKRTWSWLNTGTLPYVYKIQNNNIFGNQSIDNLNSFRTQFFRVPVTENSRIFIMNENPCTTTKFLNGATRLIVQRGDIWFDTTNNSTNPPAYIYVTQEDIDNGCPINTNISVGTNYTGGWSAAAIYGLRTFNTEDYRNNALVLSAFMSVSNDGTIDTQTHTGSADAYAQRALVPQFSI